MEEKLETSVSAEGVMLRDLDTQIQGMSFV
jgi:hypothetical protein